MQPVPHFDIQSSLPVSAAFIAIGIATFQDAATFIMRLPYRRNAEKNNLLSVFNDGCGTCSTKHALLKQLALELNVEGLDLMLGIVKMNSENKPVIAATLEANKLEYLPEAHNYLKFAGQIFDYTKPDFKLTDGGKNVMTEIAILPEQITEYKVAWHKEFLADWIKETKQKLSLEKFWMVREQCIKDLSRPEK